VIGTHRPWRTDWHNPATLLLAAINLSNVEARVLEALPWLVVEFHNLDWEWLIREARVRDVQNRLGFIVTLSRQVAERRGAVAIGARLRKIEETLNHARLVQEVTLCQASLSDAERRWLQAHAPTEADHRNLLTDLNAEFLP